MLYAFQITNLILHIIYYIFCCFSLLFQYSAFRIQYLLEQNHLLRLRKIPRLQNRKIHPRSQTRPVEDGAVSPRLAMPFGKCGDIPPLQVEDAEGDVGGGWDGVGQGSSGIEGVGTTGMKGEG